MIHFHKVVKRFRQNTVLKGVQLTIERGHRVALVGSNGAGKTTLIRCLLGEYVCDGRVTVDGLVPREHRREVLSKVGFVPQLPPPLKMPVGQLIQFAASLCDADPHLMEDVARRLGLNVDQFRSQSFVKLNLDPEARHIFFHLLAEKKDTAAMLISSHRLDEVASLVNRVVEMDQGSVVLDDRVADLVELSSRLLCRIKLLHREGAFAKSISEWNFKTSDDGLEWMGYVAGPDRLRFLGVLSRYAALLGSIRMDDGQGESKLENV